MSTLFENNRKKYWKSLDELQAPASSSSQEFPENYDKPVELKDGVSRRSFLALLSASMAVTATACRRPDHKLVPTTQAVEYQTPGMPLHYATTYSLAGVASSIVVKSLDGRPLRVMGNSLDESSKGAASSQAIASILSLYDPDRIRRTRVNKGDASTQVAVFKISEKVKASIAAGKEVRILTEKHSSPSISRLTNEIETKFPQVKFVQYDPNYSYVASSIYLKAFSIDGEIVPDISKANYVVTLESDILGADAHSNYHSANFAASRTVSLTKPTMSKLVAVESTMSLTGINSDERVKISPNQIDDFIAAILKEVAAVKASLPISVSSSLSGDLLNKAKEIAKELLKNGDSSAFMVGSHLSEYSQQMGIAINYLLGNIAVGKSFNPLQISTASHNFTNRIDELINDLKAKKVETIIFCNVNPEYNASQSLKDLIASVDNKFAINLYEDETAKISTISIPLAHGLESWGDSTNFLGDLLIQQPLIAPLAESSVSILDFYLQLFSNVDSTFTTVTTSSEFVQKTWEAALNLTGNSFKSKWESILKDGLLKNTTTGEVLVQPNVAALTTFPSTKKITSQYIGCILPSLSMVDGSFANNGWLQELADPVTKITWGNVISVSQNTAKSLDVTQNEVLRIETESGNIEAPVWIQPGMADNVLLTTTGYGRLSGGIVMQNIGSNAYKLTNSQSKTGYYSIKNVVKTGRREKIASTQSHHSLDDPTFPGGRRNDIVKELTLDIYKKGQKEVDAAMKMHAPDIGTKGKDKFTIPLNIVDNYEYKGHRWGMTIDLNSCTGCSACIIACQSENNIPVVGKKEVLTGREMAWIRLDRYYSGDSENPQTSLQPMLCQQCENAPCENVCPVAATTHSPEGLNEMTYNRCVGTRYCLNNCPYKVRRFNFLNYHTETRSPLDFVFNPEVTVRMRGIMEKCTFCVQIINASKYHAKDQGLSRVPDGTITTACQSVCPTSAIVFGDLNDAKSKVSITRQSERSFLVLQELNTRPSISYLARVRNGNSNAIDAQNHSASKH
jgi:MoCo/4Fe-4S cofactor protein with predicted Tat translocation signal